MVTSISITPIIDIIGVIYRNSIAIFQIAGVVARVESLRGRMGESTRQVEGLFESVLNEAFNG